MSPDYLTIYMSHDEYLTIYVYITWWVFTRQLPPPP